MDQISRDIRELVDKLNCWTEEYDKGKPVVSDEMWDKKYFELNKIEKETNIIYPDSPTQKIHFETITKLDKVTHNHLMLSLDKTKNSDDIADFVKGHDWFGMFKMDGLTCSLTYVDGQLWRAETRGDGKEGENITHNVSVMSSVPKYIKTDESIVVVDGEIICTYKDFEKFKDEYKNPRNFASGSIRLLNAKESASRNLTFVAWDLVEGCPEIDYNFWRLEKLDDWGFTTVPRVGDCKTVQDTIDSLDHLSEHKDYPIDGYVFKFESVKYGKSLGATEHHFKNAIAFKFYDEKYETKLTNIEWSLGRTGQLTPIAVFEPIEIEDTEVARASLHNLSVLIDTLGEYPKVGQKIWVSKINQIIPQIVDAEKQYEKNESNLIDTFCSKCPICGKDTEIVISESGVKTIQCTSATCEGKLQNRIEHYCKQLDIKWLSKKTIEKLIDWGWLNGLIDLYKLNEHKNDWQSKAGFGEASVNKILNAIDAEGRHTKLESFIAAIGIPLVGKAVAKEIVNYYPTWIEFKEAIGTDWTVFDGFGEEISKALNNFDYTEANKIVKELNFITIEKKTNADSAIKGKKFCVTGKTLHFKNRNELKADIEEHGGKMVGSVTSATDYLISNTPDSGTAKNKSAQSLGVKIITEEEYINMREE